MYIKQFATQYQVSPDTVRYYEKEGLLHPIKQSNGYRVYDAKCEYTMKFILVLKQLGFTLQEIKQLILLEQKPISVTCNQETLQHFAYKITTIEQQLYFLQQALQSLQTIQGLIIDEQYEKNKEIIAAIIDKTYQNLIKDGDECEITSHY
ncbi:MerR family transcriptional regulator [Lysinibacillus piscis]|uniref:Transcriptional regulator n=1 Tax=Lysinibacillus piscis TaxID=2518931 RepID=A0ABQ5NKN4_9BACI|nr:MerR family transcriptional regulator [Lysinibacillus sp. KH24]GLC88835.1 transcriptional regulator [Lysinibacillus sp. KH24]